MWSVFFIPPIMPYKYGSIEPATAGRTRSAAVGRVRRRAINCKTPMRRSIGRYAVTGTLGEGGMGVVYAAYDDRLGRPVAIKMIKAAVAEPAARDRLRREARSAASVNHPAICQLYEIGEEDGELFLAMELLQGESLAAASRAGRGDPRSRSRSPSGCWRASTRCTSRGLIHRDLKPSNIFLTPHGVKLLDFGLTCSTQALADETLARAHGAGHGHRHAAVRGARTAARRDAVDARTDLFAAGAVLYEMLAGKPPFSGKSAVEVFHAIMYEQPAVLTGGPAVAALDRVVNRALAKRPAERYQIGRGDDAGSARGAGAERLGHRRAGARRDAADRAAVPQCCARTRRPTSSRSASPTRSPAASRGCSRSSSAPAWPRRGSRPTRPT